MQHWQQEGIMAACHDNKTPYAAEALCQGTALAGRLWAAGSGGRGKGGVASCFTGCALLGAYSRGLLLESFPISSSCSVLAFTSDSYSTFSLHTERHYISTC